MDNPSAPAIFILLLSHFKIPGAETGSNSSVMWRRAAAEILPSVCVYVYAVYSVVYSGAGAETGSRLENQSRLTETVEEMCVYVCARLSADLPGEA